MFRSPVQKLIGRLKDLIETMFNCWESILCGLLFTLLLLPNAAMRLKKPAPVSRMPCPVRNRFLPADAVIKLENQGKFDLAKTKFFVYHIGYTIFEECQVGNFVKIERDGYMP
jgi:hypothetical protein